MSDTETSSGAATVEKSKTKAKKPRLFKVLLLNDDYTSMDFVVTILESIFRKSPSEAVQIMLKVHHQGQGLCGVYPKEIAEAKVVAVHEKAKEQGYPLRAIIQDE